MDGPLRPMVDYFPVLNRAVAALDPNTPEARRVLYDRARRALVDGLRSSDPTLSDTDLRTQSAALEDAIRQVESQYEVDALRGVQPPMRRAGCRHRPPPAHAASSVAARRRHCRAHAGAGTGHRKRRRRTEESYQDRPPLDDERKPYRMIAAGVAALAVLLGAAAAYTYWPSKTSTPPDPARHGPARSASMPSRRAPAAPATSIFGSRSITGPTIRSAPSWSTSRRAFSTWCGRA